jgi:hypothetical protein
MRLNGGDRQLHSAGRAQRLQDNTRSFFIALPATVGTWPAGASCAPSRVRSIPAPTSLLSYRCTRKIARCRPVSPPLEVSATFTSDGEPSCCAFSDALELIVAGDISGHVHFFTSGNSEIAPALSRSVYLFERGTRVGSRRGVVRLVRESEASWRRRSRVLTHDVCRSGSVSGS